MTKIKYVFWIPFGAMGWAPCPWRIYVSKKMIERPAVERERLINHEFIHIKQMYREGYWHWLWRYLSNGRWRAVYELEAFTSNIMSIVGSGIISGALADYYIDMIFDSYFPRWWPFNKDKPTHEQARALLKSFVDSYYV